MMITKTVTLALTAAAAVSMAGCSASGASTATGAASSGAASVLSDTPGLLDQLGPPTPEDTSAPYKRKDWGEWVYTPATKCSRREEILIRDGHGEVVDDQCRSTCPAKPVASPPQPPCWVSRYDGADVYDVTLLEADHRVPLAEAARSGARTWTRQQRAEFYNDPANLVMVTGKANGQKSDHDPAEYKPVRTHWCEYATAFATVKIKYGLRVDATEKTALAAMLDTCGGER